MQHLRTRATWIGLAALFATTLALSACEEESSAEKAGEKIDETVSDAERAVEDAAD